MNGKIYSIRSYQTDKYISVLRVNYYVRKLQNIINVLYRINYKNYLLGKYHYVSSYKVLEHDDCYIELIEECPCDNKSQLNRREGEITRQTENCFNKLIAGRTTKEYRTDNKDKIKQYREINKDKIKEHKKQPYTCACGKTMQFTEKARHYRSVYHLNHIKNSNV